jgi:ABC-type oligopeptide transport system substrate-binding subunit
LTTCGAYRLSYAIDRNVIADKVMGKGETRATLVPDFVDGFKPVAPAWSKLTQAERDAKAKELLTEAGYGPGKPLKFELLYNTDDNHKGGRGRRLHVEEARRAGEPGEPGVEDLPGDQEAG